MEHERLPRKLVAILYADVVGYSRLMGQAEDATHRTLADYLDLFAATVTRHQGRVVHYAGDAVLARFDSALDALTCAIEIQREIAVRNADPRAPRKVEFRIGVNLGDVIEDRGDIYGDGVNTAARLQQLAEPGHICVSQAVRTAVGNRLPLAFVDLGERRLKNIEHAVRAYSVRTPLPGDAAQRAPAASRASPLRARLEPLVTRRNAYAALLLALLAVAAAPWVGGDRNRAEAAPVTVAVLPFANLSGDVEHEYFVDGMTEALITSLAKLRGLNVISRTSIMRYRGTTKSLPEIARELGATALVEGSAQLDGDQVRITAQLITGNDRHLWAESYDRPFKDVLRLQSEIARRVANDVNVTIAPAEAARLDDARVVDVET
jgi:class 3 adenylate cyclase/TolB-like protein